MKPNSARRNRGVTYVELLLGLFCTVLMLAALATLFGADNVANRLVFNDTFAIQQSREPLDTLADHLRDAQVCGTPGTNCAAADVSGTSAVISAGASSDITYYSSSSTATGTPVRYYLSGTSLIRSVGGTNTTVLSNVSSLTLTYYDSTSYNSGSLTTTANPNAPVATELWKLAAVKITASTTSNGRTSQFSTLVRLRNSPYTGSVN
jgi:hypothetical protein